MRCVLQIVDGALDRREVFALRGFPRLGNGRFDTREVAHRHLPAVFVDRLLDLIRQRVGLVARVDELTSRLILGGVALRVPHQPIDVLLRESARTADGDLLLLAGRLVRRRDVHDAIRIDVKRDFDLRQPARRRRQTHQMEFAERAVIAGHRALAL